MGHCINGQQHWTTTLDIAAINNNQKKCCGECINGQQLVTLQQSGTKKKRERERERDLDIASLDNNIGHYNCCGHCINGQQHWTTTLDIAAINNNKKNALDSASMNHNI